MTKKPDFPISQVVVHPGVVLSKVLDSREIKQKDFASELGIAYSQLNEILKGKRNITPEFALLLEASLNYDAKYWLDLQTYYTLEKSRVLQENQARIDLVKRWSLIKQSVPVSFFKKYNFLSGNPEEDEIKLKEIYNVTSVDEIINLEVPDYAKFKISEKLSTNQVNLIGYVKLVEYLSRNKSLEESVGAFELENEEYLIENLRKALTGSSIIGNMKAILADAGIKFIIHEKPDQVPIDGIAFWSNENPTIVLTLRHKRIDNFAFTLFHELCHVLRHLKKDTSKKFLDDMDTKEVTEQEKEANDFAENNLIPKEEWETFINKNFFFDDSVIINFSKSIDINPAIVRGRLCHDGLVSYKSRTSISYALN